MFVVLYDKGFFVSFVICFWILISMIMRPPKMLTSLEMSPTGTNANAFFTNKPPISNFTSSWILNEVYLNSVVKRALVRSAG